MKRICCLYAANRHNVHYVGSKDDMRRLSSELTAEDILYLQELFLTNGFHHIRVPTVEDGRSLMYKLLNSMHFFNDIACLTCINEPAISCDVYDILNDLRTYCNGDESINVIEEYFLEVFFTDFMWIELNEALTKDPFVEQAIYVMHSIEVVHRMPVVALSYDNL